MSTIQSQGWTEPHSGHLSGLGLGMLDAGEVESSATPATPPSSSWEQAFPSSFCSAVCHAFGRAGEACVNGPVLGTQDS